ncbi:alpha/beta fold hydrolase [Homoserinibacter sp. GY 40078]|uniref:alpha/beta fold hydrolase n=1 Tax=Homoserinibacter sp. GY 40078 TaxID=2603275 RepID=UPI0016509666|nr:alpha/beta hydrolase [Homoserinibacter sp. GY 40078]
MPYTETDEIRIYFEVEGDPAHPAIVLISGGGAQLLSWPEEFVALLVAEGFRVVRFDNRDTGMSHRFGGPEDIDGGYGLEEMADDIGRVLDQLGVAAAHVVGHSMGGMMAQRFAIDHPDRVLSLGLLSTIPDKSDRYVLHEHPVIEVPERFTREQIVGFADAAALAWAEGTIYDPRLDWNRERAALAYDRGYAPEGFVRQWSALYRATDRLDALRSVTVPTFVFHGRDDRTLHWYAAFDIADAMPDAELQVHPGMGHLIPWELWPELIAGILRAARRAA